MFFPLCHNSSSDEEEQEYSFRIKRRALRDESNPLDLPSSQFIKYFRLSKEAFLMILNKLESELNPAVGTYSLKPVLKLAGTLRFVAEGSYQKGVGNDLFVGLSQSSVSKMMTETLSILERELCREYIKFPTTGEEKDSIKLGFYNKYRFPGIIGCVDGTHVKIISPNKDIEHLYYNRKGFHSLNVMLVCDHKNSIRYVASNNPGGMHDSLIWEASHLDSILKSNFENGDKNSWILGDSGYTLKPYMTVPFRSPSNQSSEARYNFIHAQARVIIERTIGMLKNVFGCTLGARGLHYKPDKAAQIVNVCCALHNIRLQFNVVDESSEYQDIGEDADIEDSVVNSEYHDTAIQVRNSIMNSII